MKISYWMQIANLSTSAALELDETAYLRLLDARDVLRDLNAFEERYEILLSNYRDFEIYCAQQSLISALGSDQSYHVAYGVLGEANRLFMNFMTSHTSYVDQVVQDFRTVDLGETLKDAGINASVSFEHIAKQELRRVYDASKDYRAICALRNHAQHSAAPIHKIDSIGDACWAECLTFHSLKKVLSQNRRFKKLVLSEMDESLDIRRVCKRVIERMSATHIRLRDMVRPYCEQARTEIEQAHAAMARAVQEDERVYALWLCAQNEGSDHVERATLMLQWDDARRLLQEKNRRPIRPIRS
ncbi:hypothetical protein [Stenotrophomonas maltophilia]|uniref:hypothetical protein n=1 Tax=Stenotrophomonas maltophilia TaxID=40324 RepID=UPI00066DEFBE|nr:hypothetical protein [Stenotrophomonas maltophilia]MBH1465142.1 hypothetical protein [Stenotrophomonas maltophilia]MBH1614177.1 hypothetical protein [Stenotrophomonas maltophilia]MBN5168052.1 hypothetical protein [Stenotrophomonas maltophilia]